jgi:hypothetical protein
MSGWTGSREAISNRLAVFSLERKMVPGKDDETLIEFMVLFRKLSDAIDDDPAELEQLVADDEPLRRLCLDLDWAATILRMNERRHRQIFSAPVDPGFIAAWRDYEERYESPLVSRVRSSPQ